MAMTPCGNGHFYDPDETSACPYCGIAVEISAARPHDTNRSAGDAGAMGNLDRTRTDAPLHEHRTPVEGATAAVWNQRPSVIDPVVGWLVCISGPDRGRDYRIHTERNFIGRGPAMDIAIAGDRGISHETHAVLSYNPRRHTFRIAAGESRGLVYVNDEEVAGFVELKPYDQIELGATTLLFVPFCGERFLWSAAVP
ncbi:FHA domain-containing protein [uncultured Thiodictyon sp.]|uniref:FHA domain-containing protein n=1 Tax=uncultured Thiodictyon sp. TaxID=1846217 RepID=UPI0025F1A144|nr:FHA domain-containing protein [uncultured Thiodictyon sp.]